MAKYHIVSVETLVTQSNNNPPPYGGNFKPKDKTMKCVIITYQSGKTAVYLKTDPALLDEILHSNDWIVELHEAELQTSQSSAALLPPALSPQPIETKGGK
jgi:predicted glycoside hydrolase/deacetylase ChbG (UPF0249 family)